MLTDPTLMPDVSKDATNLQHSTFNPATTRPNLMKSKQPPKIHNTTPKQVESTDPEP